MENRGVTLLMVEHGDLFISDWLNCASPPSVIQPDCLSEIIPREYA